MRRSEGNLDDGRGRVIDMGQRRCASTVSDPEKTAGSAQCAPSWIGRPACSCVCWWSFRLACPTDIPEDGCLAELLPDQGGARRRAEADAHLLGSTERTTKSAAATYKENRTY